VNEQPALTSDTLQDAGQALALLTKSAGMSSIPVTLSLAGRLYLSRSGWLLLSVPTALVRGVFDAVHRPGYELPEQTGIPVMTPQEVARVGAQKITERGHQFVYRLAGLGSHTPSTGYYAEVLRLRVAAPDLRRLRLGYGLDAFPQGADGFFLPVACRRAGVWTGNAIKESADGYDEMIDWEAVDTVCRYNRG
jgi:hypothetical protein